MSDVYSDYWTSSGTAEFVDRRTDLVWDDPTLIDGKSDIRDAILDIQVEMGIDLATQLTVRVHDPNFELARANYFAIGRDVYFKTSTLTDLKLMDGYGVGAAETLAAHQFMSLEIASAACASGPASEPVWTLELRNKAVQQMRRDKNPSSIKGTGHNWVINVAHDYGLDCVAESTSKTQKINKATNDRAADSTWDVLSRLASDAKFVVFESEGVLFFCSQKYLLGRWGSDFQNIPKEEVIPYMQNATEMNVCPIRYPSRSDDTFKLVSMPSLRRSDNDPLAVQGSAELERSSGSKLRAGMTVHVTNYPTMQGPYIISNVSYSHLGNDPVSIEFRSPEREDKEINQLAVGQKFESVFDYMERFGN